MADLPPINQLIEKMLHHNIIEHAASPWCSNVLIRNADEGIRFSVDYRQMNELTFKVTYPLPIIDMRWIRLGRRLKQFTRKKPSEPQYELPVELSTFTKCGTNHITNHAQGL